MTDNEVIKEYCRILASVYDFTQTEYEYCDVITHSDEFVKRLQEVYSNTDIVGYYSLEGYTTTYSNKDGRHTWHIHKDFVNHKMTRGEVNDVIAHERTYQDKVWGDQGERRTNPNTDQSSKHDVGEWMIFIDSYLEQAKKRLTHEHGTAGALDSLRKVAALCVACFEQHGVPYRGGYNGQYQ